MLGALGWLAACTGGSDTLFGGPGRGANEPVGGHGGAVGGGGTTTTSWTTTTTSWTTTTTSWTTTTTDTTTTTSSTTTGSGGDGGGPTCYPPSHQCGQNCVGNTPETGCFLSWSCQPCPTVAHAISTCTPSGQCAHQCSPPYTPNGNQCVCPTQCCDPADCQPPAVCTNGQCVGGACDPTMCLFDCLVNGYAQGVCDAQGNCVCS